MKRILFVALAVMLGFSICFAQAQQTPTTPPKAPAPIAKSLIGKVDSVTLADPTKGIKPEITLIDENGKKTTFLVKDTTTIYDADWKATTLDKITKDMKVKVRYSTTKEGVMEANSINLMKVKEVKAE